MVDVALNYKKAQIFFKKRVKVHILKKEGIYYNGILVEVQEEHFYIDDQEDGPKLVLFEELAEDITEFKEIGGGK